MVLQPEYLLPRPLGYCNSQSWMKKISEQSIHEDVSDLCRMDEQMVLKLNNDGWYSDFLTSAECESTIQCNQILIDMLARRAIHLREMCGSNIGSLSDFSWI